MDLRRYLVVKLRLAILGAVTTIVLTSCSTSPKSLEIPAQTMPAFSASGAAVTPDKWWTVFEIPALNEAIETALRDNFSLESASQRIRAANAVVSRESGNRQPEIDAIAVLEYEDGDDRNGASELQLGLQAGYEIDLWGRIRSGIESEKFRAQATLSDYHAAALVLAAEITATWFELTESQLQLLLLAEQFDTNTKVLKLLEARFANGRIRGADVLRQRQLLEATHEQSVVVQSEMAVLRNKLDILEGQAPQPNYRLNLSDLPALPPLPATGLPSELTLRRPDVQRAMFLVKAADRDMAVAVNDRYPRLNLGASLISVTDSSEQIFGDWIGRLAAELLAPVVDGRRRKSEVNRTRAVGRQRLAEYGQTVLEAFREVEDALVRERKQHERIRSLEEQVELAGRIYKQLGMQYLNGVVDYIEVLSALDSEQQLRRDLLSAQQSLLSFRIALYRALAGGFTLKSNRKNRQEPNESEQ